MARRTKTSSKRSAVKRSSGKRLDQYVSTRESVGFSVREVWRSFARCLQPRIAREGVSIGMWFALRMLWDEDGMTQRRKINIFLTERGRKLKRKLWPMAAEVLALGLSGLSRNQVYSLNKMLLQIRLNLEHDHFG